jgi:hypothetical protein
LKRQDHRFTFDLMRIGRVLRLLCLALPLAVGVAGGTERLPVSSAVPSSVSIISAPRESLPQPVHDEATCAFCQAAAFPPCAPQPTKFSVESISLIRCERAAPEAATFHSTSHRPTSSRAPPPLRSE